MSGGFVQHRTTSNRYRRRIGIAHPLAVHGHIWKPFATYEAFYERSNGGWNRRSRLAGVTLPLMKHVSFQPSYMWETTEFEDYGTSTTCCLD